MAAEHATAPVKHKFSEQNLEEPWGSSSAHSAASLDRSAVSASSCKSLSIGPVARPLCGGIRPIRRGPLEGRNPPNCDVYGRCMQRPLDLKAGQADLISALKSASSFLTRANTSLYGSGRVGDGERHERRPGERRDRRPAHEEDRPAGRRPSSKSPDRRGPSRPRSAQAAAWTT